MAWLAGYKYRRKFTVDSSKISSTLSGVPLTLYINSTAGLTNVDLSNIVSITGANKAVAVTQSDGSTSNKLEIVNWDTSNNYGELTHRAALVDNAADTDFYLYYNGAAVSNSNTGDIGSAAGQAVWSGNYNGVYHMYNASAMVNAADNTAVTIAGTFSKVAGPVDGSVALQADTDGDYINVGSITLQSTCTMLAHGYIDTGGPNPGYDNIWGNHNQQTIQVDHTSGTNWQAYRGNGSGWDAAATASTNIAEEVWWTVGVSYNGGTIYLNRDGASNNSGGVTSRSNTGTFHIFRRNGAPSADYRFHGKLAQFRLNTFAYRSDAYVQAEQYAMGDNLVTWGAQESLGSTGGKTMGTFGFF